MRVLTALLICAGSLALYGSVAAAPTSQTATSRVGVHQPDHRWKHPASQSDSNRLRLLRRIVRHDRWVIDTRRTHHPWTVARHRRELAHAKAKLRQLTAKLAPAIATWPWLALVDCESGDGTGSPPYSALWTYDDGLFEGGPNFVHSTWTDYGGRAYAEHAYDATPAQQIAVAERVLADVGWGAWPVCSYKIGAR